MAAAAARRSASLGIFWADGVSDEEQPLVYVPDVDREPSTSGKIGTKMRPRRSSECKTDTALKKGALKQGQLQSEHSWVHAKDKGSVHPKATASGEHIPCPAIGTFHPSTQGISETSSTKSLVCLKDLCPEDKRRIANLIEELARVSEEKEESVQRLKDEQETFEHKVQQLEQRNETIAQERESLQQQYRECQELLGLYQQYLTQQQAKLNQSIAQLSQAPSHSKVLGSEEAPSRTSTNGSLCDGSYLGLAGSRAQQPPVHRSGAAGRGAPPQTFSNAASSSHVTECSPIQQHRSHKRQCRQQHSEAQQCQGSGQDIVYGTQQQINHNGHHATFSQHERERHHSEEALTRPLGHEDWEEKRHQLLLQKMQLETEREKLHARLAEQEERLTRQSQQLQQAHHVDDSRFQQSSQSEPSCSNARNGDPRLDVASHQGLSSSACGNADVHPARRSVNEMPSQTAPTPLDNGNEALKRSRKDMATSPARSPVCKPNSFPVIHKSPQARLDFSVVELLEIFSPIPAPEPSRPSTRRPKPSQQHRPAPKPAGRTLLTPAGPFPPCGQQELEESQMLEDIFFIC